jgi:hypothetical protein
MVFWLIALVGLFLLQVLQLIDVDTLVILVYFQDDGQCHCCFAYYHSHKKKHKNLPLLHRVVTAKQHKVKAGRTEHKLNAN